MNDVIATMPPPAPVTRAERIAFTGDRREFRRLVMLGGLLELCTAGFYRFWLATDMRRHLWSHTSVEGDAAEYTGTARELLIGFLIALAILVPVYVGYSLVGIEAERAQAFASVPLVVFLYAFSQFAIYRARRYRATRTVWRGVRFWMTGSGWDYSWRACLWTLFAVLTLGIAWPWREAALERFKMRHTAYGDLQARFVGTGWQLFKQVWWLWLLSLPLITLFVTYPIYKGISWRWWLSGIRFGEVRFQSDLRGAALLGLYWAVFGWIWALIAVAIVAFVLAATVAGGTEALAHILIGHPYAAFTASVGGYIVLAMVAGAAIRVFLSGGVWERVARSVTVHGLEAADNVAARGEAANALGEGFADSLNIGGF